MSAFCFDRRRLRRTAWVTLIVWLFALAAGVANACVLAPQGARGVADSQAGFVAHGTLASELTAVGHPSRPDQVDKVDRSGQGQDSGTVSCLKFCDDESSAIAKNKLPVVDLNEALPTVAEPWGAVVAPSGSGFRQSPERPGAQGPPLVIRFLRLTL